MPLFGRHGNRSQHNLVEQQAQQQIQQQQQQLHQQLQRQSLLSGSADHHLPPPPPLNPQQLQQQLQGTGASSPAVSDVGPPPGPPLAAVSAAGLPSSISSSNNNPPSASSATTDPSPSDLYSQHQQQLQHQLQLQQQQRQHQQQPSQGDIPFSPQQLSQQATSKLQKRQQQQQQQQATGAYQGRPGSALFASGNPNLQGLPQNPLVPLGQATNASTFGGPAYGSQPPPPPLQQLQQQQQPGAPLDSQANSSEFVSRSQSARYPLQHIPPLQTQRSYNTPSTEDLSQPHTVSSSPIVSSHRQPLAQSQPATPPEPHKRTARGLIRSFIKGSSSKENHHHNSSEDLSSLHRKKSKRSSVLALRNNNPSQVSLEQQLQSHQQQQQQQFQQSHQQPPQPPPGWQSQGHPSPLQGVGESDENYSEGRPSQDRGLRSYPHTPQLNTVRTIPTDSEGSPYSSHDSLTQQQKQQLFSQHQAQIGQEQQVYNSAASDPKNTNQQYKLVPPPSQYSSSNRGNLYAGHLSTASIHTLNADTVSQLSHDSPPPESEYAASQQHSQAPPPLKTSQGDLQAASTEQSPLLAQGQNMAPPPASGVPGAARRSGEADAQIRSGADNQAGAPPSYRHGQTTSMNNMNPLPPTPGPGNPATPAFRAASVAERQLDSNGQDAGRNSPQPTGSDREADLEKNYKDLLTKYKNVKRLYFDGKSQIEQMTGQVELLQNAVANQRMSQSRTALDDNEYATRFNRLNGAINNLAFNIRKDWRMLPPWIESYVSADAVKTGKQEMTAVGRAIIAKWLVDEVFNKCFHPALEPQLSHHLKAIERNIRQFSYTMNSQEEFDALTSKVVNWRMATLEGLQHMLNAPESQDTRLEFTRMVTTNLTAALLQYLTEPAPAGVDGSASMIVELAVGLAANLPLESRDIAIIYPLPGEPIRPSVMELEKGALPPLSDVAEDDDESDDDKASKQSKTKTGAPTTEKVGKVRFAGSVAVEVRGRQVLVKAPVWALS